ncbi:nucleoside triphosphate pyrophosphohydrolase [Lentzea sp. NPDC051838]|uniref:nucleoside triphosphate pyrophosphohydrolase n=1 Tax=Lentzea sp. NPDC051838 TaxID=3154849 RepID=UPI003425054E
MPKLVRDRIPEIIRANGEEPVTEIADAERYHELLRDKLSEEVAEFLESGEVEELADVLEVLHALARAAGVTPSELERIRAKKAAERGGFAGRIVLIT